MRMNNRQCKRIFNINPSILNLRPNAWAQISGGEDYLNIKGSVYFYAVNGGSLVLTRLSGLPNNNSFYAMHIHSGSDCGSLDGEEFSNAGAHLNLNENEHPFHEGDLPAILNSGGNAWSAVFTNRFTPETVRGRVVIIHEMPDDYHTQPSGNSGSKIACGVIK